MVGAYPRPAWFTYQLDGRDIREAFKSLQTRADFKKLLADLETNR